MSEPFLSYRPHPWHGLSAGPAPPHRVHAFIEITPFDAIKYEIDKPSGYLRVDRPQRTSALPPVLYGFIPRTYCGPRVAALSAGAERGDGDPLDICVLSERAVTRAEVLMSVRVVGGLRLLDGGEADDKIVAVLDGDFVYGEVETLEDLPPILVERLEHYFATYKMVPGAPPRTRVEARYGADEAARVVEAALADYAERFGSGAT
ncbi:MAG TPA: inorganic pyrophosphatase [Rhodothermales bacterium]|nr:inorganic pyrophosphatase [Rhodothermales bacterium]